MWRGLPFRASAAIAPVITAASPAITCTARTARNTGAVEPTWSPRTRLAVTILCPLIPGGVRDSIRSNATYRSRYRKNCHRSPPRDLRRQLMFSFSCIQVWLYRLRHGGNGVRARAVGSDPGPGAAGAAETPAYPADLADLIGVSRQAMSNHLACLRGCGLVVAVPEGRRTRYELADQRLAHALGDLLGVVLAVDPDADQGCC